MLKYNLNNDTTRLFICHIIMSPLYRGRDILVYFSLLTCLSVSVVSVCSLHLSCRWSNTRRWPNVGLLLAHRLRRWANISPVLGHRVVFDATLNVGQRHRRRANINPALASSSSYCTAWTRPIWIGQRSEEQTKDGNQTYWHLRVGYPTSFSAD